MTEKLCGIYKITNKISGKCYIGQSVDIFERFREHKRAKNKKQQLISKAISKYGQENFEFKVLLTCEKDPKILDDLEIKLIKEFNSRTPNGYNISPGGSSYTPLTEDQLKAQSERNKGERNPMFNKEHDEETIKTISQKSKGKNNKNSRKVADNIGRIWDCAIDCKNDLKIGSGIYHILNHTKRTVKRIEHLDLHYVDDPNYIPKTKEKIEEIIKRNENCKDYKESKTIQKNAKTILDNTGRTWNSIKECSDDLKVSVNRLSSALNGKIPFNVKIRHLGLHFLEPIY